MKKIILTILFLFMSLITVFAESETTVLPSQIGKVISVEYAETEIENINQTKQIAQVKILNGIAKNQMIIVDNILTGNPYYDIKLKSGMKVILHVEESDYELSYSIQDVYRANILIFLSVLFCILLVCVGRKKGLYSLVSIIITCLMIAHVLSPMILNGINPIIATIIICLLSTAVTIYLVGGFNNKSSSAVLGCTLSITFAGLLAFFTTKFAHLNGFINENALFLYSAQPHLNFVAIVISTIILATLGAVMDVAMSIASTINEIYEVDNTKSVKELFISGMNVGRDIIGTMANTLILVYLGSSLPLILLANNIDLQKFFNLNQVVTEISSALIGSCAIVICVPITALVSSNWVKKTKPQIDISNIQV
ncbi:MAG: YibE/F family protein [Cyanobacteria bacterium SIG28]|nr:YibE/F family protein [Cyanobacteria bacterium SIG28]